MDKKIVAVKTPLGIVNVEKFNKDGISPFPPAFIKACIQAERPWKGVPHVTGIIDDLKTYVLSFCSEVTIDCEKQIASMIGSGIHKQLEDYEILSEVSINFLGVNGTIDNIYLMDNVLTVCDFKTSGSYKVALALDITKVGEEDKLDDFGNPELYKRASGKNKVGDPKKQAIYGYGGNKDNKSFSRQLNIYALAVEQILKDIQTTGFSEHLSQYQENYAEKLQALIDISKVTTKVKNLQIMFIPRDGNTQSAKSRGVMNMAYVDSLPLFPPLKVIEFVKEKSTAMKEAMQKLELLCEAHNCNAWELPLVELSRLNLPECVDTWDGRKCKDYCSGRDVCEALRNF